MCASSVETLGPEETRAGAGTQGPSKPSRQPSRLAGRTARSIVRDAAVVVALAVALSLLANTIRTSGIALIAEEEFEILVPCPEAVGEAEAVGPDAVLLRDPESLLIDVRSPLEYESWHLPGSLNQPFDWLAEQDEVDREAAEVAKVVARSGKHHVVVYGDGGAPDSGEHWAALLAASGIKNVVYVSGGAAALRRSAPLPGEGE